MKKLILILLLLILVIGAASNTKLRNDFISLFYYSPCDTPIVYSIGTIDPRFNVTSEELLEDSKVAANIWNTTQSKQLFVYKPNSNFTINMVYDSRQALTSQINQLDTSLKQKQGAIDPKIAEFKKKQADFEQKVNDLNSQIEYWNSRGGAPEEEYDKLQASQKSLQEEADALNQEGKSLGQSAQEYNLNAQKLNNTINNYQQVLQNKPEEGLYEQDGSERKISIYIDISQNEFLHTLTHEMGHALGLNHNSNPKSIMYPQTTTTLEPSPEDVESLQKICVKRTVFEVAINRLNDVANILRMKLQGNER
jgi:peptidoglycan hydrolase CwlO-like protein